MKQTVVAKLSGKSRSYVSKVSAGLIKNESISDMIIKTDEDFLYQFFTDEGIQDLATTGLLRCKTVEGKYAAGQLLSIWKKMRLPK